MRVTMRPSLKLLESLIGQFVKEPKSKSMTITPGVGKTKKKKYFAELKN